MVSSLYKQDIEIIEWVQRRFAKRLLGLRSCTYSERLEIPSITITSLKLRSLYTDLIWCYKNVLTLYHFRNELFKFSDVGTRAQSWIQAYYSLLVFHSKSYLCME